MPVNLVDIQKKLKAFSIQAKQRKEALSQHLQEITGLVNTYANRLDELDELISQRLVSDARLRCAQPAGEPLNLVVSKPDLPKTLTILAADGSQINPSRHYQVEFCVINVGLVIIKHGSGETPQVITHSQLLDYDAVFLPGGGMITEGLVALQRDLLEREALAGFTGDLNMPAISMTDGPLELYHEPGETEAFTKALDKYMFVLDEMKVRNLITLGYVDKPGSDLIVRLLELTQQATSGLKKTNTQKRRYAGVTDRHLLENLLSEPGDRSAIFKIVSPTAGRFPVDLAPHFFFLNVGRLGAPHLARVEIPAWVAETSHSIDCIQAALLAQAHILGTKPYPYALHRAHEAALVSISEHKHVEDMIMAAFSEHGVTTETGSNKQYLKDIPAQKTRYRK